MKADLIAILKTLNEQMRQKRYYEANRERKLTAANERNHRRTRPTLDETKHLAISANRV